MRLAVISDTHVPGRETRVPDWVRERLRAADHVVHAGDFDAPETLALVRDLAGGDEHLTAVRGNVDPPGVDLPATATLAVEDVRFLVTHGTGNHAGYRERVAGVVRDEAGPDAVGISGHTHRYLDATTDGVRLLNPGSATGARPATTATMMHLEVEDGDVSVTRISP
jgi:hypothetical protein